MKKEKNKRNCFDSKFVRVLAIACLSFVLTGCGKGRDTVQETVPVRLSFAWWGNDDRNEYTIEAMDKYQQLKEGNVEIICKYGSWNGQENRMHVYMKSKKTPDVMLINYSWIDEYSSDGLGFYDLNTLSDVIDLTQFQSADLELATREGKLNAVPIAFNTQTIYYNKDLFDKYGLNLPETWEDLFTAAEVMKEDGIYPLSMMQKSLFLMLIAHRVQETGKELVFEDGMVILSKEDLSEMLRFYKEMIDKKVMIPIDEYSKNDFTNEKVAGTVGWISDAGNNCDVLSKKGRNVVVGEYPVIEKGHLMGWYVKPATLYAISSHTEHPQEAAELLNFLLNSEEMTLLQKTEKGIPLSKASRELLVQKNLMEGYEKLADEKRQEYASQMKVLEPVLEKESLYGVFKKEADYYLYDKLSLEKVVDSIYSNYYEKE